MTTTTIKRTAIYDRVSTPGQAETGNSLESQLKACRAYVANTLGPDYAITIEFDEADSGGERWRERPKGRQLCEMIERGEVDAVVIHNVDRYSRRPGDGISTAEDWLERGTEFYLMDLGRITDANDIRFIIGGWSAAAERTKIRERTMRGRREAIEGSQKAPARVVGGGAAKFGYAYSGKKQLTQLVIEPAEAETVKQIFNWYVYGDGDGVPLGVVAIVKKLNAQGMPTRKGGRWLPGVIYGMLRNEVYAGVWNAYRMRDTPRKDGPRNEKGRRRIKRTRRPREDWRTVAVPAIVDRETWDAAQKRLSAGRYQAREIAQHEYLLSGRLKCSCGYHMAGFPCTSNRKKYLYYKCGGKDRTNTKGNCHLPLFRVPDWDAKVWDWVHEMMMHPEKLTKGMRAEQATRRSKQGHLLKRLDREKANIAKYDAELDELARQLYQKRIKEEFYDREKPLVERLRADAVAELEHTQALIGETTLTDEHIAAIEHFAAEVAEGLEVATFVDKRKYLAWLEFSAQASIEDGEQVIYATCQVLGGVGAKRLGLTSALHPLPLAPER